MQGLLILGCGRMGQAMLTRWLACDALPNPTYVVKPSPLDDQFTKSKRVIWLDQLGALPTTAHISHVMLAVKPQMMAEILPSVKACFGTSPIYMSIAAGLDIDFYKSQLGQESRIIRTMPNTPVTLGEGVTTLVTRDALHPTAKQDITAFYTTLGLCCWLEDESLMDVATALAGSGPAYAYLFMDAMTQSGIKYGLPSTLAKQLAIQTVAGSARMANNALDESLTSLREQVTSKGGTTEAALQQLMNKNILAELVDNAISAAITRADALRNADKAK